MRSKPAVVGWHWTSMPRCSAYCLFNQGMNAYFTFFVFVHFLQNLRVQDLHKNIDTSSILETNYYKYTYHKGIFSSSTSLSTDSCVSRLCIIIYLIPLWLFTLYHQNAFKFLFVKSQKCLTIVAHCQTNEKARVVTGLKLELALIKRIFWNPATAFRTPCHNLAILNILSFS